MCFKQVRVGARTREIVRSRRRRARATVPAGPEAAGARGRRQSRLAANWTSWAARGTTCGRAPRAWHSRRRLRRSYPRLSCRPTHAGYRMKTL